MKKRYVMVGCSCRGYSMFVERLVEKYADVAEITGVYDPNYVRAGVYKEKIGDGCTIYDDFDTMIKAEKPDAVVVTTVDSYHHEYIVRALDMGCDAISEKPLTNTYERCKAIRDAEKRSGHKVTVTFNCRFMPFFATIKELLLKEKVGKVLAINYEYCLSRWHGGDYMKRWHRLMENSEGLLLHKSTHHFDIINWLLCDEPKKVCALANRVYYNDTSKCLGERCRDCVAKDTCETAVSQWGHWDKPFYFDAEHVDGYIRDRCAFKEGHDIYDNMSVSVMYNKGTLLTYTLNLFSEHEGYRMVITGEKGVIIANHWDWGAGETSLEFLGYNGSHENIPFVYGEGAHGGGDEMLVKMIFSEDVPDPLGQQADSFAGMVSAMIGIGANESIKTGKTVELTEYLDSLR
ncbi:MAG: Gfo/Idh/MocA family oxidoreductase [Clostridia bacterium]|nr:Gfo/Idh/MocA family oxidoreductase [Clostridia bacterium]